MAIIGKSIEAVLFDLDGTLIDSVPDLAASIDQMLLSMGQPAAGETKVNRWVGNGAIALVQRALLDDDRGDELHRKQFANAHEDDRYVVAYGIFESTYAQRLIHATGLYPGVNEVLAKLDSADIKMALVTNKPRIFTLPLLKGLNIHRYFSEVICGDDLPHKKPHPLPVITALEKLSVNANNAVMVGDSVSDVTSAQQAGVNTIAVTYGYNHGIAITDSRNDVQADVFIDEIQQLLT